MGPMLFGQKQPRRVNVCAGDMRMDVDSARHGDEARRVDRLIGFGAFLRRHDPVIAKPEIADRIPRVGRIDDVGAFDVDQHAPGLPSGRWEAMRARACATLGAALGAEAVVMTRAPASGECMTPS